MTNLFDLYFCPLQIFTTNMLLSTIRRLASRLSQSWTSSRLTATCTSPVTSPSTTLKWPTPGWEPSWPSQSLSTSHSATSRTVPPSSSRSSSPACARHESGVSTGLTSNGGDLQGWARWCESCSIWERVSPKRRLWWIFRNYFLEWLCLETSLYMMISKRYIQSYHDFIYVASLAITVPAQRT